MDFNGLTVPYSGYTDALGLQNSETANKLSSLNDKDLSTAADDELMDVCKDFEAYFMEMVMKEMLKTVNLNEDNNAMVDYFMENTVTDMAKQITNQNPLGLAQQLYEQMKRNYSAEQL